MTPSYSEAQKTERGIKKVTEDTLSMKAWAAIIRRYVHELLVWGFHAWPIWLSIFPMALIHCLPRTLEDRLRYGGLAFELLGIATVALGLSEKGRQFDRQVSSFFVTWWASRPRFGRRSHVLAGTVNIGGIAGMSAYGMGRHLILLSTLA